MGKYIELIRSKAAFQFFLFFSKCFYFQLYYEHSVRFSLEELGLCNFLFMLYNYFSGVYLGGILISSSTGLVWHMGNHLHVQGRLLLWNEAHWLWLSWLMAELLWPWEMGPSGQRLLIAIPSLSAHALLFGVGRELSAGEELCLSQSF